ncbi:hypothetical protein HOR55_gp45 [Ralstonia phage RS-PII-1]|uniref:Uncharacterized protein n=1 Tax=Ralstonia phage RS-PII-1 TaxID=1932892 RepID=A0A1L7DQP7_9CAUD|nr:hypothetical protein HOR55_gp45 [Ralstonia phage RS-PII-1]APU00332.1 hypothetical protein [Ralstonia phage RS-PII-1]
MFPIKKLILAVRHALARYEVMVEWDGSRFMHRAGSLAKAYDWMRQYPANAQVAIGCRYGCGVVALRAA